ncbi:hypothetical protein BC567DRAFT_13582 [Phyllosticta citribraziliensis]
MSTYVSSLDHSPAIWKLQSSTCDGGRVRRGMGKCVYSGWKDDFAREASAASAALALRQLLAPFFVGRIEEMTGKGICRMRRRGIWGDRRPKADPTPHKHHLSLERTSFSKERGLGRCWEGKLKRKPTPKPDAARQTPKCKAKTQQDEKKESRSGSSTAE